jgi:chromosome segregation ATPase
MFSNKQKQHYAEKMEVVQKNIWDFEFKGYKIKEMREDIRSHYDRLTEGVDALKKELEKVHEDSTKKELETKKAGLEKDISQLKNQIEGLDMEMNGYNGENGFVNGVVQQLDALHSLKTMLKEYSDKL